MNKPIEATERNAMAIELAGVTCRCGETKVRGQSFCPRCFYRLTKLLRQRIRQHFGKGYEQAYRDAVEELGEAKRKGRPAK